MAWRYAAPHPVKPGTHIALEFSDGTVGATADGEAAPAVAKPKQPSARSRSGEAAQGKLF